ncbi:KLK8 isoform 1 [Pongo abelii]|uniref:Kallikrein-8 n=3 Tax=Pongo TaxID=9599 RepID=H2NZU6_PONAB|nr:KLK8 isoform 1 [Pongo abelii]
MGRPRPRAAKTWMFLLLLGEAWAACGCLDLLTKLYAENLPCVHLNPQWPSQSLHCPRAWRFNPLPPAAGHSRAQEDKVLGGQECQPHSQPWQAALFQGQQLLCGGVLIGGNWVLTAAHCKKPKYTVRLGDHSLQNKDGPEQEIPVVQSIPHPCYNSSDVEDHNHDLMLLQLRDQASLGSKVKPISLADHCTQPGQKCTISGWGTVTSPRENFPDTLNCAEVKIFPQKKCEDAYPGQITDGMVCAGSSKGADTCQGDSGGPLVCDGALQGITSWGSDPCGRSDKPGVYTNICRYLDWIKKIIGSKG